jgi:hypothetical protein
VQHVSAGGVSDGQAGQESAIKRQIRAGHEVDPGLSETGEG